MLKQLIRKTLRAAGYQLQKLHDPEPVRLHIDVFSLCMMDLLNRSQSPFVLQIGANDGVRADPVRRFILDHALHALLVEPHPVMFEILKSNYVGFPNARFANVVISDSDGILPLYGPDQDLLASHQWLSGLCSLSKEQVLKELTREQIEQPATRISETKVPAMTAAGLLQRYSLQRVDVLQIDTEGFDWHVLSQFDLIALGVKLINLEFFHLKPDERAACLRRLTSQGYETAFVLGDLVAYRQP
jgi:FkbM family methyltransferase